MSAHPNANPLTIPQRVYDWYNAHYSNVSYRAFRNALVESSVFGRLSSEQSDEEFVTATMNGLIDASFERSGADHYRGAETRLMQQIAHLDSRLTTLARIHLMNFGGSSQEEAEQALIEARQCAEIAAQRTSDIHSWRGRVAYAWASAAMFLLHAAFALLVESNLDSYPLEKLDRALGHLQSGVSEARQNGVTLSDGFSAWIVALVKSRH